MSEEEFTRAERDAERTRSAREREQIDRAPERVLRDIDSALSRPDIRSGSEMGQGPPVPPAAPPASTPSLSEQVLELKRARLEKELREPRMTREPAAPVPPVPVRHDSPERREAIQRHLERLGLSEDLRQVRELLERGSGAPASEAPRQRFDGMTNRNGPGRGYGPERAREERERDERERGKEGR